MLSFCWGKKEQTKNTKIKRRARECGCGGKNPSSTKCNLFEKSTTWLMISTWKTSRKFSLPKTKIDDERRRKRRRLKREKCRKQSKWTNELNETRENEGESVKMRKKSVRNDIGCDPFVKFAFIRFFFFCFRTIFFSAKRYKLLKMNCILDSFHCYLRVYFVWHYFMLSRFWLKRTNWTPK